MFVNTIDGINNRNNVVYGAKHINKRVRGFQINRAAQVVSTAAAAGIAAVSAVNIAKKQNPEDTRIVEMKKEDLKEKGISYLKSEGNMLIAATRKNGAFYKIEYPISFTSPNAEIDLLWAELNGDKDSMIKGLRNYKECVDDLGRQDIINKALNVDTYELNTKVSNLKKSASTALIRRHTKKDIKVDDLFFIGGDAVYYDKLTKAIHVVKIVESVFHGEVQKVYTYHFLSDDKGNTIGYENDLWNVYIQTVKHNEYKEQQEPSEKLPECVEDTNNKLFAESCRFGNAVPAYKTKKAIPDVLKHLEKVGFENVTEADLQFVKAKTSRYKGGEEYYLINYYNPKSGMSLVYNDEGKYMYQLEYVKNAEGKIISCNH